MEPKVVTDMDDATLKVTSMRVRDTDRHGRMSAFRKPCSKLKRRIVNDRVMITKIRKKMKVNR